jgi:general stress protein 26
MEVAAFAEIEEEFIRRVHSVVWCNVATVDRQGRPRSRIWHPLWEGGAAPHGWIITRRHTLKARHLEHNPYVSAAYVADIARPVYADCVAEWMDDLDEKQRVWDAFKIAPPPLGYDFGQIFAGVDDPGCGVLRLTPWRIEVGNFPGERYVWRPASTEGGSDDAP